MAADGLVLDVGSGSCPYPRSDVLLERYVSNRHRCGATLLVDRPLVIGDALAMPFKDKAFDFVVASHVLEHSRKPERFLKELMRVGKAGYIETPNALFERLIPYDIHCLEILSVGGRLLIHKKSTQVEDRFLGRSKFLDPINPRWRAVFWGAPDLFHVRHFWRDSIEFEIDNPQEDCRWLQDEDGSGGDDVRESYTGSGWRSWGLRNLRRYYKWRSKRPLVWSQILACPECHGDLLVAGPDLACAACRLTFLADPHPDFLQPRPMEEVRANLGNGARRVGK